MSLQLEEKSEEAVLVLGTAKTEKMALLLAMAASLEACLPILAKDREDTVGFDSLEFEAWEATPIVLPDEEFEHLSWPAALMAVLVLTASLAPGSLPPPAGVTLAAVKDFELPSRVPSRVERDALDASLALEFILLPLTGTLPFPLEMAPLDFVSLASFDDGRASSLCPGESSGGFKSTPCLLSPGS